MITIAVQIQLQYSQAPKWRPSSILAEAARICYNPAVGSVWGGGGGNEARAAASVIAMEEDGATVRM
jgi:hypothetical protein